MEYFLGVDVGTASVRVGLFDSNGGLVDQKNHNINVFNYETNFYEQSSEEIWNAVCLCIKKIVDENCYSNKNLKVESIVSIGFDATCSLVVLDENSQPISVSPSGNKEINVVMWMDHRSKEQAQFINSTGHECLKSVGGSISLEMDPPKILWLKQNMLNECYNKASVFFSLPDYLVWRASNLDIRSICCTTCKWLYKSSESEKKWDVTFWNQIGLGELAENNFKKVGSNVEKPFRFCEELKISADAVSLTGLSPNVRVGISMIDAHAGGVGGISLTLGFLENLNISETLNVQAEKYFGKNYTINIEDILILVSGTSSCLMASSRSAKYISGIWGPYYEAMIPLMWLNEAGQSAAGKLIDHLISTHPAYQILKEKLNNKDTSSIYDVLNDTILSIARNEGLTQQNISKLTRNIHIYPDFHGNRSPLADSHMTGLICGLSFDTSLNNLAITYLACIQSLAYQTRHIINEMNSHGIHFKIITIIGGLANNKIYCQLISDICKLPVLVAEKGDSIILLGSSILGASNYDPFKNLKFDELLKRFSLKANANAKLLLPEDLLDKYHEQKYQIYLKMVQDQKAYRDLMLSC